MRRRALIMLALVLGLLEGAPPAAAQVPASVGAVGGIVKSQNGVPLEGAEVALEGFGSTVTDRRGLFVFRNVPPGNYRLSIYKQGFSGPTRSVLVRAGSPALVDIVLDGFAEPPAYRGPIRVALIPERNGFLVPARLNGRRDVLFLLDTGATLTAISRAVADELGIYYGPGAPIGTVSTANGRIQVPLATVTSIEVGAAQARNVMVIVHDFDPYAPHVVGVLGLNFLSRFRFQIDLQQALLLLAE